MESRHRQSRNITSCLPLARVASFLRMRKDMADILHVPTYSVSSVCVCLHVYCQCVCQSSSFMLVRRLIRVHNSSVRECVVRKVVFSRVVNIWWWIARNYFTSWRICLENKNKKHHWVCIHCVCQWLLKVPQSSQKTNTHTYIQNPPTTQWKFCLE